MISRKKIILIAVMVIFGMSGLSFAMMCGGDSGCQEMAWADTGHEHGTSTSAKEAVSGKAVNVGNTICPVTGEVIYEDAKATYEYNGRVYNLCCPACIDKFRKDPKKYAEKAEETLQTESVVSHESHEGHHHEH